jgi:hypothetical protein
MKKIKYSGIIKNGLLHVVHRKAFDNDVSAIGKVRGEFKDVRVFITVEKFYKKRSNPENSYYWAVVVLYFVQGWLEVTGEKITHEEAHNKLKDMFSKEETPNIKTGEIMTTTKSTTKHSTVEFEEYLLECRRFIAENFGMVVPLPNEDLELFK